MSLDAASDARAVRYGIHVAPFGELADPARVADLAVRAEAAGFEGFFPWDHIDRNLN